MPDTSKDSSEYLEHLSQEFDALTQIRHEVGAEEYGDVAFLKAPLVRMAAEELADMANYCRYMYIKLRILEDQLDASGINLSAGSSEKVWESDEVPYGASSFISAEEIQGFFQGKESSG